MVVLALVWVAWVVWAAWAASNQAPKAYSLAKNRWDSGGFFLGLFACLVAPLWLQ